MLSMLCRLSVLRPSLLPSCLLLNCLLFAGRPDDIPFAKHKLFNGANETAVFLDFNGDKRLDIVSGEHWFQAPATPNGKWQVHRFRDIPFFNNYVDDFTDLAMDVNGDGRMDVISCSWFSKKIAWFENPGKLGAMWKEHPVENGYNVEFMFFVDLNNDGKAQEVLPQFGGGGPTAWYEFKGGKWVRHIVSPKNFGHGIGAGDVNGDGRTDVLTPQGWWEAPADLDNGTWLEHADWKAEKHVGFLHVLDVNKDGRNDVIYPHAHAHGIYWMEQKADKTFVRQLIDDSWSQVHASELIDLNGDGQKDLVAGKRFLAHDHDPGAQEPLGLYWYEFRPKADGKGIEWIRHIIDYSSDAGAGMQIALRDYDQDGDLDFAVAGKSGAFLFENLTKQK